MKKNIQLLEDEIKGSSRRKKRWLLECAVVERGEEKVALSYRENVKRRIYKISPEVG